MNNRRNRRTVKDRNKRRRGGKAEETMLKTMKAKGGEQGEEEGEGERGEKPVKAEAGAHTWYK